MGAIGNLHRLAPDRDNIDKALLDALFPQDKAIAMGHIEKRWDWEPRMEVTIEYTVPVYGIAWNELEFAVAA